MTTRRSAGATTATLLLLSTLVGCSSAAPLQSVAAVTDAPTIATPTPPPATPAPTP
ncbi:MAG: deoxyribonuclease, partial [Chloroflexota bacterium]